MRSALRLEAMYTQKPGTAHVPGRHALREVRDVDEDRCRLEEADPAFFVCEGASAKRAGALGGRALGIVS